MTPRTLGILKNPHPKCHIIYPYPDDYPYANDAHVAEAVSIFAAAGLDNQESVVLITTNEHASAIESRLVTDGFDVKQLKSEGRLMIFEAEGLLRDFMDRTMPDATKFSRIVADLISKARSKSVCRKVRLYGEMVNLLCGRKNLEAAAYLEDLWNKAIEDYSVPLLCSYSTGLLEPHTHTEMLRKLLDAHSHIAI